MNKCLSHELAKTGEFIPKHCYDNVFNNIGKIGSRFKDEDIRVMFGYVSVGRLKGIYTRHACFYLNDEAVDPTLATLYGDRLEDYEIDYIPFKVMTIDEYFRLLSREHNTDLFKTFKQVERIISKDFSKYGITLIG